MWYDRETFVLVQRLLKEQIAQTNVLKEIRDRLPPVPEPLPPEVTGIDAAFIPPPK